MVFLLREGGLYKDQVSLPASCSARGVGSELLIVVGRQAGGQNHEICFGLKIFHPKLWTVRPRRRRKWRNARFCRLSAKQIRTKAPDGSALSCCCHVGRGERAIALSISRNFACATAIVWRTSLLKVSSSAAPSSHFPREMSLQ